MQGISNLQADGTMKHGNALGAKGQVYSRIQPGQEGEVQVAVDGSLRTLPARANDSEELISTGEMIEVVEVIGSILIVEKIGKQNKKEEE